MELDKKDLYIKGKLQEDKKISSKANDVFEKFKGGINLEKKDKQKEPKMVKLTIGQAILIFISLVVLIFLGVNLYAHIKGKPNIYSAIRNLFIKEDSETSNRVEIAQNVESEKIYKSFSDRTSSYKII